MHNEMNIQYCAKEEGTIGGKQINKLTRAKKEIKNLNWKMGQPFLCLRRIRRESAFHCSWQKSTVQSEKRKSFH